MTIDDIPLPPAADRVEPDGTLRDVPLWRVQWTELPGFQNVLNVWQPHYTHMFMSVVNGPRPWYFGHVHLPGGTESLNKTEYRLEKGTRAPLTGVLMQVGDYKQLDDGRLVPAAAVVRAAVLLPAKVLAAVPRHVFVSLRPRASPGVVPRVLARRLALL